MSERRNLSFKSAAEVAGEVTSLRRGHERAGNWSLAQACSHLNFGMSAVMRPGPHAPTTPEQASKRGLLEGILAAGKVPSGIVSPEGAVPAADCGEAHIEAFLKTLATFEAFAEPFAPHPRFGALSGDEMRRMQMIHCAHHLGFLSPK